LKIHLPILARHARNAVMRCYYVFVHGKLDWKVAPPANSDVYQPRGFYCHRYVLAADQDDAASKAFKRIRKNLDRGGRWLSSGEADLSLEADEISPASIHRLLAPDNRGHTFYEEE